tara:strand:- start:650 stop:763 length:114 start_codon:yes stop_codon:yes gene_type:complete
MINLWWEMIKDLFNNPVVIATAIVVIILLLFNLGLHI